jgi:serine/threonine-protein kinase RsbW
MVERVEAQHLRDTYPAVAESVGAARGALVRFAAQAGLSTERLESVRLATSEALTNAVRHAYPDRVGSIHITAAVARDELCILIADDGCGLRPHLPRRGLGLGLTLIASLCDELQIATCASGGTELCLWFTLTTTPVAEGHSRGSVASAISPARSRFSTTTQPDPESTIVSSSGRS